MDKCPQPLCPAYVEMVSKVNQAIFFCYNESSERLPVSIVNDFLFIDEKTLTFNVSFFPMTEKIWDVFAAELFFYKKGFSYSLILHGVAVVSDPASNLIRFNIQHPEYFMQAEVNDNNFLTSLVKPYLDFYRKGTEIFSTTFNKKLLSTALHRLTMHSDN